MTANMDFDMFHDTSVNLFSAYVQRLPGFVMIRHLLSVAKVSTIRAFHNGSIFGSHICVCKLQRMDEICNFIMNCNNLPFTVAWRNETSGRIASIFLLLVACCRRKRILIPNAHTYSGSTEVKFKSYDKKATITRLKLQYI